MLNLLDMIEGHFNDDLIIKIREKKSCQVVGDNLNIKTNVRDIRTDNRNNRQHNWFMSMVVFERLNTVDLNKYTHSVGNIRNFDNQNYLMSEEELMQYKTSAVVLTYRIFESFFGEVQSFKVWKGLCPTHIEHPYSKEMSQNSQQYPLPMHFNDEKKLAEMADILCELEDALEEIWENTGITEKMDGTHIPDSFKCPFSGDQLTSSSSCNISKRTEGWLSYS